MLHYFPEPRPEELFLSIVARYGEHLRLWRRHQVQEQLFGKSNIAVGVELPRALDALVERLPAGIQITAEELISNHSLLPLYLPFIPPASRDSAKQAMRGDTVRDPTRIIGGSGKIKIPNWLRFCPICWKEDRQLFGEPYWRRLHQAPGVEVCVDHHAFLEESRAPRSIASSSYTLHSARMFCYDIQPRKIIASNQEHQALLGMAQDIKWLLEENFYYPDTEILQRRYSELLYERGLAVSVYKIRYDRLRSAIKNVFSDTMLRRLDYSLPEDDKCRWVRSLTRQQSDTVKHPLYHLALIRALGFTAKSFFDSLQEMPSRFGRGPWPCNKPICSKYKEQVIEDYKLEYDHHRKKVVGIFSCWKCGYTYRATGIINSVNHHFVIGRCCDRGNLWRCRLTELWNDKTKTLQQIKQILTCSDAEIIKQVSRMNLPVRESEYESRACRVNEAILSHSQADINLKKTMRSAWLNLQQQYPHAGIKQLQRLKNSPHSWLMSHDRAWLLENRPLPRRRGCKMSYRYSLEDWASHDRKYVAQINLAVAKLKLQTGRPVRISKSAICRAISLTSKENAILQEPLPIIGGHVSYGLPHRASQIISEKTLTRLPLTNKLLSQVIEPPVDCARRRLVWASEKYREEAVIFTKYQLVTRAGVRSYTDKQLHRPESVMLNALAEELCGRTVLNTDKNIVDKGLGKGIRSGELPHSSESVGVCTERQEH